MDRKKVIETLEELKKDIAYLGKDEVDDPEEVMNGLAIGSKGYVEALEHCLTMLQDDLPGPDN